MNVETGTEAAWFPEKEYINGIVVAVRVFKGTVWHVSAVPGRVYTKFTSPEAALFDEIQTKVLRVLLLAIHSSCYTALPWDFYFFQLTQPVAYFFKLTQPLTYFYLTVICAAARSIVHLSWAPPQGRDLPIYPYDSKDAGAEMVLC
jgi:hypothetical protein